ncbi:MAG: hypothetical protein OEM63_09010 [Gammaproteobacteria bacterium]|nr:hypothetical protein [Gammaproteobacteria bacterium]
MNEMRKSFGQLVLAGLLSGAVASVVVGVGFTAYVTRVEEEIRSQRQWKEESVAELLGPINIQFDRTKRAFERWESKNLYLELKIIKIGNETIRDLLLTKGHLIPPELLDDAGKLIEHYDVWLEIFEKQRGGNEPDLEAPFTFAGPAGYPFPRGSERNFKEKYGLYWNQLYAVAEYQGE